MCNEPVMTVASMDVTMKAHPSLQTDRATATHNRSWERRRTISERYHGVIRKEGGGTDLLRRPPRLGLEGGGAHFFGCPLGRSQNTFRNLPLAFASVGHLTHTPRRCALNNTRGKRTSLPGYPRTSASQHTPRTRPPAQLAEGVQSPFARFEFLKVDDVTGIPPKRTRVNGR